MYYGHSACIMSYRAHVRRNSCRWESREVGRRDALQSLIIAIGRTSPPPRFNLARRLAGTWYGDESQTSDRQLDFMLNSQMTSGFQQASMVGGYRMQLLHWPIKHA